MRVVFEDFSLDLKTARRVYRFVNKNLNINWRLERKRSVLVALFPLPILHFFVSADAARVDHPEENNNAQSWEESDSWGPSLVSIVHQFLEAWALLVIKVSLEHPNIISSLTSLWSRKPLTNSRCNKSRCSRIASRPLPWLQWERVWSCHTLSERRSSPGF